VLNANHATGSLRCDAGCFRTRSASRTRGCPRTAARRRCAAGAGSDPSGDGERLACRGALRIDGGTQRVVDGDLNGADQQDHGSVGETGEDQLARRIGAPDAAPARARDGKRGGEGHGHLLESVAGRAKFSTLNRKDGIAA